MADLALGEFISGNLFAHLTSCVVGTNITWKAKLK